MEAPCLTLASRVRSQFALLPSTRSTRGLGGRTAYGIPVHGHVVAAQVECGAEEASPPPAEAWFKAPSLPTGAAAPCHGQGTCGEWLPHVTPPHSCSPLRAPLGPYTGFSHTLSPLGQVHPGPLRQNSNVGIPARGHMVVAQVECGSGEASPSNEGMV